MSPYFFETIFSRIFLDMHLLLPLFIAYFPLNSSFCICCQQKAKFKIIQNALQTSVQYINGTGHVGLLILGKRSLKLTSLERKVMRQPLFETMYIHTIYIVCTKLFFSRLSFQTPKKYIVFVETIISIITVGGLTQIPFKSLGFFLL